jgi:DNA-binding NarL/FixJ family response regulator
MEARPYLPIADVIVLELELRDGNGLHLIQSSRADGLQGRTLGLALDDRQIDKALQAGVTAVLHQSVSLNVFVETVQGLASRAGQSNGLELPGTGSYVESEDLCDSTVDPIQPLTKREHDILEALIEGLGDKQIARQLGIKTRTAETHIANICRKLGARSRLQVLVIAHRSGLINLAQKADSR